MKTLIATCLLVFIANLALAASPERCPEADSRAERNLILEEGPAFVDGGKAGYCLRRVIDREIQNGANPNERELMQWMMTSAWKAEVHYIETGLE